jgi:hypothetical protein
MIYTFANVGRWVPLLAVGMLVWACDGADTLPSEPATGPVAAFSSDTAGAIDSLAPGLASGRYSGVPYGPIGMWSSWTDFWWGPGPFTGTQNFVDASGILKRIEAARSKGQRLILAMATGPTSNFTTNGRFDYGKWKKVMVPYNTSAIKQAVAAAVADGTIVGNMLIDEPETKRWGGALNKALIDDMARYVKSMFPTLPVGVNYGPPGYQWRTSERYRALDYIVFQYNHNVTSGNVAAWRDAVLAQARAEGVTPGFSLNLLDGGRRDTDGNYGCNGSGQAGRGTYWPNCRMTASQVKEWGQILGSAGGCTFQMWRYNAAYMARSDNQAAFKTLASHMQSQPRRSCGRPS